MAEGASRVWLAEALGIREARACLGFSPDRGVGRQESGPRGALIDRGSLPALPSNPKVRS